MTKNEVCKMIDHTNLKPQASEDDIRKLCAEAAEYGFASVCVNTSYLPLCAELLKDTDVKCCVVVGFPLGACSTETMVFETLWACDNGADEIDMVLAVGAIKSKDYDRAETDIRAVRAAAKGKTLKVIIETGLLTDDEKRIATDLCAKCGADFVKTCTGFSAGHATPEDVALIREELNLLVAEGKHGDLKIKASGGIRTAADAIRLIEAGADRLGASAGCAIADELA